MKLALLLLVGLLILGMTVSAKTIIIENRQGSTGNQTIVTGGNETLYDASYCNTSCDVFYEVFGT